MRRNRLPHPNTLTAEQREEQRRLFVGANAVRHDAGAGNESCYFTRDTADRWDLIAFRGKAIRPAMHYTFRKPEHRADYIERFTRDAKASAEHRAQERQPHTLKPGDILYTSWGYEQTNVEFYEVRAVRGAVVDLQQLAEDVTDNGALSMQGNKTARAGEYVGGLIKGKRPTSRNTVRIDSCATAFPWDGRPKSWSSYA